MNEDLKNLVVKTCLRSSIDNSSNVMILDTMGELASIYSLADVAFVGGSIDDKVGGHNPLEIIQQNVPLICGKNCRNFADIVGELIEVGGVELVSDTISVEQAFDKILNNKQIAENMVKNASEVLQKNKGAICATMKLVKENLRALNSFEME